MDVDDIRDFASRMTLAELADYLCRSKGEVAVKLEELKLSLEPSAAGFFVSG